MTTPGVAEQSSPSSSSTIEQKLKEMFTHLENGFNQSALLRGEPTRAQAHLKQLTNTMADGKKLIKEYERKAKEEMAEGGSSVTTDTIQSTKKRMVSELNRFVTMKKIRSECNCREASGYRGNDESVKFIGGTSVSTRRGYANVSKGARD